MKKSTGRSISLLLILAMLFGAFAVSTGSTYAKSEKWKISAQSSRWVGDSSNWVVVYDANLKNPWADDGAHLASITKVKSSNTKVVKPQKAPYVDENGEEQYSYYLDAKKSGKAKITVYYTTPAGKTGTKTKTITVKKYPNQIRSLAVDGNTVKTSSHKYYFSKTTSKKNVKIKMALKDGWEISEIYAYKYKKDNTEVETKVTKAMLKKGSAVSFPKTYKELNMTVVMTNGSKTITYDFSFGR